MKLGKIPPTERNIQKVQNPKPSGEIGQKTSTFLFVIH